MTEDVALAALAVIELTARQIVDPERTQLHRDELAVILRDVDPVMVALEVATVLAGVAVGTGFPLGQLNEAKRARLLTSLTGTDATSTVLRLRKTQKVQTVVIDPHSPGATIIRPLADAEVTMTPPSTSDVAVAHGTFLDELAGGRLRPPGSRSWTRPSAMARSGPWAAPRRGSGTACQ